MRERIAYVDHTNDKRRELDATVPLGVLPEHGVLHVKDPGKPYRAFASASSASVSALQVTVKKMDFYPDRIDVVVTFENTGENFVTLLPYGKSVLRDDHGGVYRIFSSKDWSVTDKRLFQGVPARPELAVHGLARVHRAAPGGAQTDLDADDRARAARRCRRPVRGHRSDRPAAVMSLELAETGPERNRLRGYGTVAPPGRRVEKPPAFFPFSRESHPCVASSCPSPS